MKSPTFILPLPLACALTLALPHIPTRAQSLELIRDGPTLAAHVRSLVPPENSTFQGQFRIRKPHRLVPITGTVTLNSNSWSITYATKATHTLGAQQLTIVHQPGQPNLYHYAHAPNPAAPIGSPQPLLSTQTATPFAGSDFWICDLGLDFLHWPNQRLFTPEMRKGRSCKVLESRPAQDANHPYARVLSWIDVETAGLVMAEAYDKDGKRLKEFEVKSFRKVNGQWQLQEMEISSLQSSSRTTLQLDLTVK